MTLKFDTATAVAALAAIAAALAAGCASTTPTREVSVAYAIYDVTAGPEVTPLRLSEAVKLGLQTRTSQVQVINGIPPVPLPQEAPRFQLTSPLKGNLATLAAASGQALQVPTCDGATLTAHARDTSMARYGEGTTFFVCVMPYQAGHALNFYTTFSKASGGMSAEALGAMLARSVVGDSSQFIPRTINSVLDSVRATGATVRLVQTYP